MKPEKVIRIGAVSASIFANTRERDGEQRTMRSIRLQRRYKDASGEWKSNSSFTLSEATDAAAALAAAIDHLIQVDASHEA